MKALSHSGLRFCWGSGRSRFRTLGASSATPLLPWMKGGMPCTKERATVIDTQHIEFKGIIFLHAHTHVHTHTAFHWNSFWLVWRNGSLLCPMLSTARTQGLLTRSVTQCEGQVYTTQTVMCFFSSLRSRGCTPLW